MKVALPILSATLSTKERKRLATKLHNGTQRLLGDHNLFDTAVEVVTIWALFLTPRTEQRTNSFNGRSKSQSAPPTQQDKVMTTTLTGHRGHDKDVKTTSRHHPRRRDDEHIVDNIRTSRSTTSSTADKVTAKQHNIDDNTKSTASRADRYNTDFMTRQACAHTQTSLIKQHRMEAIYVL